MPKQAWNVPFHTHVGGHFGATSHAGQQSSDHGSGSDVLIARVRNKRIGLIRCGFRIRGPVGHLYTSF